MRSSLTQLRSLLPRLALAAAIVFSFIWAFWIQEGDIGSGVEIKDGFTKVWARTAPIDLVISVLFLLVYCVLLNLTLELGAFRIAPMWKRIAAFCIDFWIALFALANLFGTIPLVIEAFRTGVFKRNFARDYAVPSDASAIPIAIIALVAFSAYFVLPLMKRTQTVGFWLLRLATVNLNGFAVYLPFWTAVRRVRVAFRGVCSPRRTFRERDEEGRTFYDRESGFTVVEY